VEPWLGGKKPQSLSFSVSHTIVSNNFRWLRESGQQVGSFQNTAFTLGLSRRLQVPDDFFSLSNSISYLIYNKNNFNNSFYSIIPEGISHNLTYNTTLSRYSIDNQQFPTRGSTLSLSVTATPPWQLLGIGPEGEGKNQLVEYHKWMFDSNWYTKLVGKLVLSTRVHFGFLGNYTGGDTYTPFERFVVGGSGLTGQFGGFISTDIIGLRGYDNFSLNPRIIGTDEPIGGVVFNKYVMEFRYPITASQAANIFVLGFLEGGNTWTNYSEFNPFKIRRAAGVGARIFMPAFGMIGIDVGRGFDPIPGRKDGGRQVFQFSIGQQIR
jgi:outer membrane protein insertion porin family